MALPHRRSLRGRDRRATPSWPRATRGSSPDPALSCPRPLPRNFRSAPGDHSPPPVPLARPQRMRVAKTARAATCPARGPRCKRSGFGGGPWAPATSLAWPLPVTAQTRGCLALRLRPPASARGLQASPRSSEEREATRLPSPR